VGVAGAIRRRGYVKNKNKVSVNETA